MRVVSLIASATEIVAALGCESWLVGRSHECDFPPEILDRPVCSAPRIDIAGNSREIDDRVKQALGQHVSIYEVHAETLKSLAPDVIVTQTQCDVCAVSLKDVERAFHDQIGFAPAIVPLAPFELKNVWEDIDRVATALQIPERGQLLIARLQQGLEEIRQRTATLPRPTLACVEWIEPPMCGGNWIPELAEIAGGHALFSRPGEHSPWLDWNEFVAGAPDFIVVLPCGWGIDKAREEMHFLTRRPEWSRLKAVRENRVFLTDGNQYFNRPGPRLLESTRILAEILHPEQFPPSLHGDGWVRFESPDGVAGKTA